MPGSGGSVPCQIFPCRALMIRAVPNISVPCRAKILVPKNMQSLTGGASQKLSARGRGGLQAPRQGVWGAGSPPGSAGGLGGGSPPVKTMLWYYFMVKPIHPSRTRFSNGLAYNRSKVSVKNIKSSSFILTFRDPSSHICQIFMRMAR